jgi:hypothetical protein
LNYAAAAMIRLDCAQLKNAVVKPFLRDHMLEQLGQVGSTGTSTAFWNQ